ncbi:capsular biosynthesis protein [Brevundimonas intermedia]|uniref:non-specific protein-tyrosine kinase n=1 Tax=Brevundimonas intermedia TaxID=74315 RepID=A0A4Y9S1W3_9CAUL|nr:AAA family ATPase [Brevundimonas intermedia]TFW15334.1 capsular biosynthesis protein [Brevundimonas intermedia]
MTQTNDPALGTMPSDDDIDLQRYVAAFRRRAGLFMAVATVVCLIVLALMLGQTPVYTATANLQINTRKEQVIAGPAVLSALDAEAAIVDTEVEVLKSPQLAAGVVDALNLAQDPEFNARLRKSTFAALADRTGRTAIPDREIERQQVIDAVSRRLTVRRVGLTYSMAVGFTSDSPTKAARIANAFAERYLQSQLTAKFDANSQANAFLGARLEDLRRQVETADAAVSLYRIENGLLSAQGATLTEQEISVYNQQLASARAQQAEQDARLRTARSQMAAGSNGDDVGEALTSPVVQNLRAQRAAISIRVADLSVRYGPLHPDMIRARQELADIDAQIQAEIRRVVSNLDAQAQVAQQRAASVQASLNAARGVLADNNAASVRLRELEGEAEAARAIYRAFLDRYRETSAQTGVEQADARIVSRATPPTSQSAPNLMLSLALGLVLGVGVGALAVIVANTMQTGLGGPEDIERKLGLAPIGTIPLASSVAAPEDRDLHPIDLVLQRPLSVFTEAFRALRTSITPIVSVVGEPAGRIVAVTSALPGEGKTTAAVCLTRVAARSGGRILLIDGDPRRRGVTRMLGLDPNAGLAEVLHGAASWRNLLVLDPASGAHVLPLSGAGLSADDLFAAPPMDALLTELRQAFDLIVIDTAPVLVLADARVLAAKADSVLLLARWRKTPARTVAAAVRILNQSGARTLGVTLTQVDVRAQARQDYGHAGYDYQAYRKYYAA